MMQARRARAVRRLVVLACFAAAALARADENTDLDLIPPASHEAASDTAADARHKIFLEDAFTQWKLRDGLEVPLPPPQPPHWQDRLLLDVRKEWSASEDLAFTYSGRLNLRAEDDLSFPTHEAVSHDFREGFASWEAAPRTFIDAGRINLKSGVATGFNPTDFFKTRAVVQPLTADPTVLREDRLGTLMLRAQHIGAGGALSAAFAPGLYKPTPLYSSVDLPSFNPMFDRTNAHSRMLIKGSVDLQRNFSPELLLYREGSRTSVGANLTASLGQSAVLYTEWAASRRPNLIEEALSYGLETGTFPSGTPSVLPHDTAAHVRNDLAVGASYTTSEPVRITFNLEYHYHEAAFSSADWNNWFGIGHARASVLPVTEQLWYLRSFALDQQEPVTRHAAFLRFDWVDAFVPKLELSGFIDVDLHDDSSLVQMAADYYLSNAWTVGVVAAANLGSTHSDFGSLPQSASVLIKAARYF
jgi:hypothetical protein